MGRTPAKSPKTSSDTVTALSAEQNGEMTALRDLAMRLLQDLNGIADKNAKDCDSVLLRKGDGVIDGLNKLSQILVRIAGKGRHSAGEAENPAAANAAAPLDDAELERRIAAEVDRIAAARGKDRGLSAARPHP